MTRRTGYGTELIAHGKSGTFTQLKYRVLLNDVQVGKRKQKQTTRYEQALSDILDTQARPRSLV